ncbi:uncharacterized protein PAN0_002c1422 [Moesziomyces antarcticus]|uniref:uncharacterized protein n=1 Tax=Pseudozyma antarctica TaxID=84753 RepID=UPI0007195F58|nr:uncharacterized protein PAN0_002c1422 [Moesziomyces antarcticus]GAK63218.1 hypothetical protein PAN0_002c1422 [Moesziomyces antarcticus]
MQCIAHRDALALSMLPLMAGLEKRMQAFSSSNSLTPSGKLPTMTTDEIPTLPTIEVRWSVPNDDVVSWLADLHEDSRVGYVDGWHQDRDYHEITVRYHVDKPLGEFIDQIRQIPWYVDHKEL